MKSLSFYTKNINVYSLVKCVLARMKEDAIQLEEATSNIYGGSNEFCFVRIVARYYSPM